MADGHAAKDPPLPDVISDERSARAYAEWYARPRGAWIGQQEFDLLRSLADVRPAESVLDVGCGTGYFTRRFARHTRGRVMGLDPSVASLEHARGAGGAIAWVAGVAEALPFRDASFDITIAVTSLCFVAEERSALREMFRVTRRRFALGLLNRSSLLWRAKGRGSARGSYEGARWHRPSDAKSLVADLPLRAVRVRTAVFLPSGGGLSRLVEPWIPSRLPWGAFLAVVCDV